MNNKFCPVCGQVLGTDAKFCDKCGYKQVSRTSNDNTNNQSQQAANAEVNVNGNQNQSANDMNFGGNEQQKMASFTDAIKDMMKRLFTISGCSSRSEFWYGQLVISLCLITLQVGLAIVYNPLLNSVGGFRFLRIIIILVTLALAFLNAVGLIMMFRRLHDANMSGNFMWLGLIPFVGWIILIVFFCQPTKSQGKVRFGDHIQPTKMATMFGCAIVVIFWVIMGTGRIVNSIRDYHINYEYNNYYQNLNSNSDSTDSSSDDTY